MRSSVAYAVSAIAHWDWPEAWPQLFNLLMEMLVSGDLNAVHGAMRVLTGEEPSLAWTLLPRPGRRLHRTLWWGIFTDARWATAPPAPSALCREFTGCGICCSNPHTQGQAAAGG